MAETQSEVIERITKYSERVLRGMEDEDLQSMADSYNEARDAILSEIQNVFPGQEWNLTTFQAQQRAELLNKINQQLERLEKLMVDKVEQSAMDQLQSSMAWTTYTLDQGTPDNVNVQMPDLPEQDIRAMVNTPFQDTMFSQRYGLITDQMSADIRGELIQSMINGESMDDAASRIEDVMGDALVEDSYSGRAMSIARTEMMRAQNLGRDFTYDQNSDLMDGPPIWLASADDRLCPWCLRRDGLSDEEIQAKPAPEKDPWGNSATRPLHPRCRCIGMPNLKSWRDLGIDMPDEYDDEERGMRNEDGDWVYAPVQSVDDWLSDRGSELGLSKEDMGL